MPTLKDYLGSLLRDLNHARVIADVETAHIAKMYAEDNLLKHFSIPRMKIQETELTIPIAIDELDSSVEKDYQPIDNKLFYAKTYAEIKNVFKVSSFNRDISTALRKAIYSHIDALEKSIKSGAGIKVSLDGFSETVSDLALETIISDKKGRVFFDEVLKSHNINDDQVKEMLVANLTKYLQAEIKPREMAGKIENAQVTVESDKLKDKRPESLLYIKMKITEESMEWQTMEDADGNIVAKLMVE
ncbi:hypothetical protein H4J58_12050 [Colwellia sp. MB3u-70]|uniref:hypothetical protein n=1 Tax=unclassified Colwellia TaxID=196834 RepID=UPI0015F45015|nr:MULTISPECIES: hypothetical protein [unclassified Colwellia]MBA6293280.1 hypothetical protein [Colwellia sp. MB3u-8]MBA6307842.1 hypothetical protein [Colwellia sp. MB3u-70]